MAVTIIHVFLVLVSVILFHVRQKLFTASITGGRSPLHETYIERIGDTLKNGQYKWLPHFWPYLQRIKISRLKYKRDPIIAVDNDDLDQYPHDKGALGVYC